MVMPRSVEHFFSMDLDDLLRGVTARHPRLSVPNERSGDERIAARMLEAHAGTLSLASNAFQNGARIPALHTADGAGRPPPLRWHDPPPGTRSLVLLVEDPDSGSPPPFVHWLLYGIPPRARTPEEALQEGAHVGRNSLHRAGWVPCAPPRGDPDHRYFFQLFALDVLLGLDPTTNRASVLDAIEGHILAGALYIGTYSRQH
jgi:Raf kinase inhibitor-like YbhB/YbcL family protein